MKTLTTTTWTLTLALGLIPALVGCAGIVGGAESSCDQAVDHMALCGVTDLPDPGTCSPEKEQLAAQILEKSCAEIGERSTFSGSSCSSVWAIFNPSCWFGGGGGGGGGGGNGRPLGASCTWDSDCAAGKCQFFAYKGHVCAEVMTKKGLGDPCNHSNASWCPHGTICHNNRCLGYAGAQCDQHSDCISNVCNGGFWGSCK